MARFPSLVYPAALVLFLAPFLFAQNAPPPTQPATEPATRDLEQTETVFSPIEKLQYFVLEHRSPEQLEPADAELLKKRRRDVQAEAEFYGYDMSTPGWAHEQAVCSMMPDDILLRYWSKDAAGADSIFTVLVPRNGGRIWVVPVLSHGATRFKPAPSDPRNFQLFNQIVPADMAKTNSGPDGKWLLLSVCYAEMTGARPQVPNQPSLDIHMIKAPPPTLRISVSAHEHEVRFVDPTSPTDYRLWDITYNEAGRITGVSDDQHGFGEPVVKTVPEPTPKEMPQPPAAPVKIVVPESNPQMK
jgi:hypothetical protein